MCAIRSAPVEDFQSDSAAKPHNNSLAFKPVFVARIP